jgi:hypothetical protein
MSPRIELMFAYFGSMQQNLARIGLAVLSVAMLIIGVLSLVDFWPRWVWISLGALGLVGIIVQFVWQQRGSVGAPSNTGTVNQIQRGGGKGSTNNQAARDININQPPRKDDL